MKLTIVMLLICVSQLSAAVYGQRIVFSGKNITLPELFKEITKKTGYTFAYNPNDFSHLSRVNIEINEASITEVLDKCLENKPFEYIILDKTVVIKAKENAVKHIDATSPVLIISGRVVDENNQPMPGVTVKIKGEKKLAWVTDNRGQFLVQVPNNDAILVFSFVGYSTLEFPVKAQKDFVIKLHPSLSELDQVQVTAYGQTSKRLNPGNVVSITAKDIEHNPVTNVLEALQGRVPGLFIQQNSGTVGGSFDIRIRDSRNFSGSTKRYDANTPKPLIIIDGVSVPSGTLPQLLDGSSSGGLTFGGGNFLNYINPAEIESIDVLKDADATAIYGSRGAYGVILITTKSAKPGAPNLNVNVFSGVSVNGVAPKVIDNTPDYLSMRREALKNDGVTPGTADYDLNGQYSTDKYTDWRKFFIGNAAANTKADASYSGGNKLVNYRINGGYHNQQNIVRGKGSARDGDLGVAVNTRSANDRFKFNLQANYGNSVNDMLSYNINSYLLLAPNAPDVYLPDGSLNWVNNQNPASIFNTIYKSKVTTLGASTNLSYNVLDNLILRASASYNDQNSSQLSASPSNSFPPLAAYAQQAKSIYGFYNLRNITVTPMAEYSLDVGKGNLNVKVGGEVNDRLATSNSITGSNYSSDALILDPAAGSNPPTVDYNVIPFRNLGVFGIIKYVWNNKYIIDLNGRRDGSTRFGNGRRFGNFGSVAGAWIFSEEKWLKKALPFISYGKLRGSTGVVGGDAVQDFAWANRYLALTNGYVGKTGLQNVSLANPELEWEKNRRSEVGLEMGFFSDRLLLQGDYYYNKGSNQLLAQPLPSTAGFKTYAINSDAVIRNTGWEASISSRNVHSKTFDWTTRVNITIPKSKLVALPNYPTGTLNNFVLGKSTNGILLVNYAGVNPQTGNYQFINAAGVKADYALFGAGSIDLVKDKTQFVDLNPKFYGGFGNTITYKALSLDFFFAFTKRMGRTFLGQQSAYPGAGLNNVALQVYEQRWQKPGDITNFPRLGTGLVAVLSQSTFDNSTGAYEDASYARLQNLSLTYVLPQKLAQKLGIKRATVFLQGQNLLTISKYGNLDPENLDAGALAPLRIFTAGINITF